MGSARHTSLQQQQRLAFCKMLLTWTACKLLTALLTALPGAECLRSAAIYEHAARYRRGLQQAPGAQLGGAFTNGTLQMHPAAMSAQSFAAPEPLAAPGPAAALLAHMEAPPASPVLAGLHTGGTAGLTTPGMAAATPAAGPGVGPGRGAATLAAASTAEGSPRAVQLEEFAPNATFQACPVPAGLYGDVLDGNVSLPSSKSSIFDQLSGDEIYSVMFLLEDVLGTFAANETAPPGVGTSLPAPYDNALLRVELLPPKKAEALAYLDGDGPEPLRYALAIVQRGEMDPPDIMEYSVGPLPLSNETATVIQLRQDGDIPWVKRPFSGDFDTAWIQDVVLRDAYTLRTIFSDVTGGSCSPGELNGADDFATWAQCSTGHFEMLTTPQLHANTSQRFTLLKFLFQVNASAMGSADQMFPVPLDWMVDETGQDLDDFVGFNFEHCGQGPFATAADLLAAYNSGEIKHCSAPYWNNQSYSDWMWATTDPRPLPKGVPRPPQGPQQYEPAGPRYTLYDGSTGQGKHFTWGQWSGHISVRPQTGLAMFDIRFAGERIIYELAMQDQFVQYNGFVGQGIVTYFDSYYRIGVASAPLIRGVDCPQHAAFFDTEMYLGLSGSFTQEDDVCIFEQDAGTSATRHTHPSGPNGPHADGYRETNLVVRTIATLENYDYIYSITFHQDGSIHVSVTMAGYCACTFWESTGNRTAFEAPFGTQVAKNVLCNLHDHMSGWKVDLDVGGTNNTFINTGIKMGTWEEALQSAGVAPRQPAWAYPDAVAHVENAVGGVEQGLEIDLRQPSLWRFAANTSDDFESPRSYAIAHDMTTVQLLPPDHPLIDGGAAAWTKYHLAVTQHKDNETWSHSAWYDSNIPQDPVTSLDFYMNNETIVNSDLVAWVMCAVQHLPRREDVPIISNLPTGFTIKPINYFQQNPYFNATLFRPDMPMSSMEPCADTASTQPDSWASMPVNEPVAVA